VIITERTHPAQEKLFNSRLFLIPTNKLFSLFFVGVTNNIGIENKKV
jgi:hypothetical protein